MDDPREFERNLQGRLQTYAWVLMILACVLLISEWGDDITQWLDSFKAQL